MRNSFLFRSVRTRPIIETVTAEVNARTPATGYRLLLHLTCVAGRSVSSLIVTCAGWRAMYSTASATSRAVSGVSILHACW